MKSVGIGVLGIVMNIIGLGIGMLLKDLSLTIGSSACLICQTLLLIKYLEWRD
jgi:hypothetical protein